MNKRIWLLLALSGLLLAACRKQDPDTPSKPEPDPEIVEPVVPLNDRIDDGRMATAYVTYYGSLIPDASVLTHINYAFAELYMVDGVYKKFDVQSSRERFNCIAGLKKEHPELKICLSFTHGVANCPYVATMDGAFFCGYDNPRSIGIKGDWARQKGLRGLMFWEYDQDDAKGTLRRAIWNAVMTK